jgi:hypothetical protein
LRVGRLHSPRRHELAPVRGGPAQAWRRVVSHGAAFAALLALLLAPLHLCCVHHSVSSAASFEAALGPGAQVVLCAHGEDSRDRQDRAPVSPGQDHCPGCHLVNGVALIHPLATAEAAYAQSATEILAPPETLGFRAATKILAARPRGPPVLI